MLDILDYINEQHLLEEGDGVLLGVSGGADSVCLLFALSELGYEVSAVHVEHGIRGEESLEDTAKNALLQIEEKQYSADLVQRGIPEDHILKYGFAFEGEKCLIRKS